MRHFIKKQILEFRINRELDPIAIQERLVDRFWMDILPVLEAEFDKVAKEEIDFRIDRLQIDLGYLTEEMIESGSWAILFKEKLIEQLQLLFKSDLEKTDITRESSLLNIFDQWYYFIQHGFLPWNAAPPSSEWFEKILEAIAVDYNTTARLRKLIIGKTEVAERIVLNHSDVFTANLIALLTAENQTQLTGSIEELVDWLMTMSKQDAQISPPARKKALTRIWIEILRMAATDKAGQSTAFLVKALITQWLTLSPVLLSSLKLRASFQKKYPLIGPIVKSIIRHVQPNVDEKHEASVRTADKKRKDSIQEGDNAFLEQKEEVKHESLPTIEKARERITEKLLGTSITKEVKWTKKEKEELEEGIYVTHAGLVLLHPFLHTFFRKLELVKEGAFIEKEKQERAICLLHELAKSNTEPYEYDLVLPKLLCGWPLHQVVNTGIELSKEEKNEAAHLLQAVIEQWEILKNTSILGLQETFLQREGKLHFKNENWWLQVEKKSMDILLDHLPWTIRMIKLPWMKELLRVEWR